MEMLTADEAIRELKEFDGLRDSLREYEKRAGNKDEKNQKELTNFFLNGVRPAQYKFFLEFIRNRLGEDFKGILLFANFDMPLFYLEGGRKFVKLGHWDYADSAYSPTPLPLDPRREALKDKGIINPERVPDCNLFCSDPVEVAGRSMILTSKTVRLIRWNVGDWPLREHHTIPEEIKFGIYDLVNFHADYSHFQKATKYSLMLARQDRFIVAPMEDMKKLAEPDKRKVKTLLSHPNLDYGLYQKVSND